MDISGSILPQKAIPSGHVKFQIHCVKEHQVTGMLSLSFHRKFWVLLMSQIQTKKCVSLGFRVKMSPIVISQSQNDAQTPF